MAGNEAERRGGDGISDPNAPLDPNNIDFLEVAVNLHKAMRESKDEAGRYNKRVAGLEDTVSNLERRLEGTTKQFTEWKREIVASTSATLEETLRAAEARFADERQQLEADLAAAQGLAQLNDQIAKASEQPGESQSDDPAEVFDGENFTDSLPEASELEPKVEPEINNETLDRANLALLSTVLTFSENFDGAVDFLRSSNRRVVAYAKGAGADLKERRTELVINNFSHVLALVLFTAAMAFNASHDDMTRGPAAANRTVLTKKVADVSPARYISPAVDRAADDRYQHHRVAVVNKADQAEVRHEHAVAAAKKAAEAKKPSKAPVVAVVAHPAPVLLASATKPAPAPVHKSAPRPQKSSTAKTGGSAIPTPPKRHANGKHR